MNILKPLGKGNPFPGTLSSLKLMDPSGNAMSRSRSWGWICKPRGRLVFVLVQMPSGVLEPVGNMTHLTALRRKSLNDDV